MSVGTAVVGKITVSANAAGNIIITNLPITASISGGLINSSTTAVTVTDDVTGQSVSTAGTAGSAIYPSSTGGTMVLVLANDNTIAAGSSKTYDISIPIYSITGTGANSASVALGLGAASSLTFSDVNGGATAVKGAVTPNTFIVNYPTGTVSIHN